MRVIVNSEQARKEFVRRIEQIDLKGRMFTAEFKLFRRQRSLKQNKLYWMWLHCIRDDTGNDPKDLHEYFSKKYLPWVSKRVFEEEVTRRLSTAQLDSKQFTEYLERIKMEMLNQGIFLPEPGEQGFDDFYARYGV
jgi:hypothetical protein